MWLIWIFVLFSDYLARRLGSSGTIFHSLCLGLGILLVLFCTGVIKSKVDEHSDLFVEKIDEQNASFADEDDPDDENDFNVTDASETVTNKTTTEGYTLFIVVVVLLFIYIILRLVAAASLWIGTINVSSFVIKSMSVF